MSEAAIIVPHWTADHLMQGQTLYRFTHDMFNSNTNRRPPPTRCEVNAYWTVKVMEAFPKSDDPTRINLLEQNACPLIEDLWEKRADEKTYEQKFRERDKSGIHISDRIQTKEERRKYPYAVLMSHPVLGEITVPSILLVPLRQLSYRKIARKIINANPTKAFSRFVLQEIWEAILAKVYAYEYIWREQKKTEYSESDHHLIQNMIDSKTRKRSEVEEHSDDSDVPLAKVKRVKSSATALEAPSNSDVTPSSASEQKTQMTSQMSPPPRLNNSALSRPTQTPTQTQSSSRPQADGIHPVAPVHASDPYKLSDKEAEMVGRGVAPWPYDPRTGKKTNYVGEYAISKRELHMDMMGIPPWTFDPRTGVKTKISSGYGRRNVSQYGMIGVKR